MFKFFHGAPYSVCVVLKNFYLFVFCFGGLLFVACVRVCRCGDIWRFVWWGNMGRVGTGRLYSVLGVRSECGGWCRGGVSGGLWGLDRCGCFGWWVD